MATPPSFIALSVAGSDPTGGAGIQGDLQTFAAHGVRGAAVVTAVTAQNAGGVSAVHPVPASVVAAQLDAFLSQARPDATKTGMLFDAKIAAAFAAAAERFRLRPLVVDPVLESSAGGALARPGLLEALLERVFPLATVVTPNRDEAARILRRPIGPGEDDAAAVELRAACRSEAVLLKGGHATGPARDVLATESGVTAFTLPRLDTPHRHGTGCALSAAIAARLARGTPLVEAVRGAKSYVHRTLAAAGPLGSGPGSVRHDVDPDT